MFLYDQFRSILIDFFCINATECGMHFAHYEKNITVKQSKVPLRHNKQGHAQLMQPSVFLCLNEFAV